VREGEGSGCSTVCMFDQSQVIRNPTQRALCRPPIRLASAVMFPGDLTDCRAIRPRAFSSTRLFETSALQ
jgi:hypothetical protein